MSEKKSEMNHVQKIGLGEKLGYGVGDLASNLVFAAIGSFMTFFYTDIAAIPAAAIGTIMLISRIFDGGSDIAMGFIIDRTKSKYGKARPWILRMAFPFGIAAVALFSAPDFGPTGKLIYAFITYNLMSTIIYTAINVPYGALNSLLTQDQYQRSMLNIFRMVLAMIGMLLVNALTIPVVKAFGDGAAGWQRTFMLFGGIATVLFLITFAVTKERVKPVSQEAKNDVPFKEGFKALKVNYPWMTLVALAVVVFIGQGLFGSFIYYAQYILGNDSHVSLMMMAMTIPMILGMIGMTPFIKKFGKRNVGLVGSAIAVIGQIVMISSPMNFTVILVGMAIKGIALAPLAGTVFAMVADTIEYGEWKSGVRTEGLVYSAASFGTKVGSGLGVALIGWTLAAGGYVGGAEVQAPEALNAIKILFLYVPIGLAIAQFVLLMMYKLDKQYPQIVEELHHRNNGGGEGNS